MKKTIIPRVLFIAFLACLLTSCGEKKSQFTITGEIQGDKDKFLYLENVGTSKITLLDSLQLGSGTFTFKHNRPQTPDFYRLRLGNQIINLAIDSTETLTVAADETHFATAYTLGGDDAESQKIKQLTLLQLTTAQQYNALRKQYEAGEISMDQYRENANVVIEHYKTTAKEYILSNFLAPSAYFALFQQIDGLMIFDIYDKSDNKLFGAVANAWNSTYPESLRAVQLKNLYTSSLSVLRGERPIEVKESDSKTLYDVSLPALDGKEIRLSEVGDGKITLIDFTAYNTQDSPRHNMQLAEIYTKYKSKGLEIYQISLDSDNHYWKNVVINLPWICVRDPQSIYSSVAQKYNVINIPTTYIRNSEGDIVSRIEDYSALDKEIAKQLK
jgi:peroxiredoxin